MFSIVATETSVLTFVSVPGLAYRGDWFFLQLALGYILGRVLVSVYLLPQYFKGNITSIYEIIGSRFGTPVQKTASGIFLLTRVFADGVRFLATAVVVQVVTGWPIWMAVLIIGIVTVVYTLSGGMRTVLWVDSFQFVLYLAGGAMVIIFILSAAEFSGWQPLIDAGKMQIFRFTTENMLTDAWYIGSAFFGGTLLSFATHGADYMMVQRVLTCGNLKAARRAMVGSGLFVFLQFLVFLLAGSLIWVYLGGMELQKDRELSSFIVHYLPIGVKGILLAGVLSAAMSTLSSSINALAASTVNDWFKRKPTLQLSIIVSAVWALLLILIALLFDEGDTAVVVLGLKIASFTYGGLLGLFLLSRFKQKFSTTHLIIGLLAGLAAVFLLQYYGIAWTWYIGCAVLINIIVVICLHRVGTLPGIFLLTAIGIIPVLFGDNSYRNGLDVMESGDFKELQGKKVGLVVNHTSLNREGKHIIELAYLAGIEIQSVFTPEHGFQGMAAAGEKVDGGIEPLTGAKIYSLYGKSKKPTKEMLQNLDVLVFDMQDIGVRYYTYLSTLTLVMEAAAENKIHLFILDRVNPLLRTVKGPVLDKNFSSFVGMHPIPILHGMSLGELSQMINSEGWLKNGGQAALTIIPYQGVPTKQDLKKVFNPPPSPNMPNLETAWLYQGLCLLEGTNISEGRGTDSPFMQIGAPWLKVDKVLEELEKIRHPLDVVEPTHFIPTVLPHAKYPKYEGEICNGFLISYLNDPIYWTVHLLSIVSTLHPEQFRFLDTHFIDKLYGSDRLRLSIKEGGEIRELFNNDTSTTQFIELRKKYLIY